MDSEALRHSSKSSNTERRRWQDMHPSYCDPLDGRRDYRPPGVRGMRSDGGTGATSEYGICNSKGCSF